MTILAKLNVVFCNKETVFAHLQNYLFSLLLIQEKTDENAPLNPNNLTQFRVKKDMRLAPLTRVTLSAEMSQTLDECLTTSKLDKDELYLSELKEGKRKSLKSQRTWPIGNFLRLLILTFSFSFSLLVKKFYFTWRELEFCNLYNHYTLNFSRHFGN